MLTIYRFSLSQLLQMDVLPLTRESVIGIARRICRGPIDDVRIVATIDHEGNERAADIEIATIELDSTPSGDWALKYISHPSQSSGLTAKIIPCASDFSAFIRRRKMATAPCSLLVLCADELEAEGLGPLACLNLRTGNPAPLVPSKDDVVRLMALAAAS